MATTLQITSTETPDNPVRGDLYLSAGDLLWVDGVDATREAISQRLRHVRGEFFLDQRTGVPYFGVLLRKNPNVRAAISAITAAIASVPGVLAVEDVSLTIDRPTRAASVAFVARHASGAVIRSEDFGPLLLEI